MKLTTRTITPNDARQILRWHYEPPYDIYNFDPRSESDIEENIAYITDPAYCFYALDDEVGELVAFCSFGKDGHVAGGNYAEPALDIGLGVNPRYTGQGNGRYFRDVVLELGRQTFAPATFRVTIAAFNKRAQRLWQNGGFVQVQQFVAKHSKRPFLIYTRSDKKATF